MSLLDILQGVGHVLDTPGSVVRGLLSGNVDKAMGGVFDPSQRVSGRDLTDSWGLTDAKSEGVGSSLAGLAAQLGTDPLMYLGGPIARLLGGGAKAADGGEAVVQAAGGALKAAPGTLTTDASPLSAMLQNRRDFTVLKDVGVNQAGNPTFSRAIGGMESADPTTRAMQVFGSGKGVLADAASAADDGSQLAGAYNTANRTATILKDAPLGTMRHETGHALIDAAARSGTTDKLPWLARTSSNLQEASSPTARALGQLGEETWANAIQSRGAFGQMRDATKFLMNPVESYAQGFDKLSPFVGNLYRSRAIPMVPAFTAGAAGGGTLGAILSSLGGEE